MKFLYGIENQYVDVTHICVKLFYDEKSNIYTIPANDNVRSEYFNDHCPGIEKHIIIFMDDGTSRIFNHRQNVYIDNNRFIERQEFINKLTEIQKSLKIENGSFNDEYEEQIMITTFVNKDATVLEIGGNIGRSSLIIASKINDSSRLIIFECDKNNASLLEKNKNLNKLNFTIINKALSEVKLIQKEWDTIVSDVVLSGYNEVETINYESFKQSFDNYKFDTLVLDCEGAFYNILKTTPQILDNIYTIIVENDYKNFNDYLFVHNKLTDNGFNVVYNNTVNHFAMVMRDKFYQVYKKYH